MDLNPLNKPKRKRTVNKAEWTKEKRKRLRIAGKEYVNAKGEVVSEKEPGPDCKCRRRCYEKVSKATRLKLFKGYYALKSHDEQNAYLFGLIRKVPIARKRAEGSTRRTCTFNYYIRVGGQETQVCVKALANIHGVGKSKIHILCEKLGQSVLFPRDERGRHSKMPKKVSEDTVEMVKNHIYSILHSDKARDFLKDEKANNGPDVNITQMHKDFLDVYDPEYTEEINSHESQLYQQTYVMQEPDYRHHLSFGETQTDQPPTAPLIVAPKKKRKIMKDGRPEPLIRQWYYSKIFHELYTTKEAIALRKKIISWKTCEDFIVQKPARKQRQSKKVNQQQQTTQQLSPQQPQHQQIQVDSQQQMAQRIGTKSAHTNTAITITTQPSLGGKKIVQELQIQNMAIKKKPLQVFQTTTNQESMYSIYPMILESVDGGQAVNLAQPIQQGQMRTITATPTHFQTATVQPHVSVGNGMTISASNLQALGVNINLTPATHYSMSYKFE